MHGALTVLLQHILEPEPCSELYGDFHHAVGVNYYPPRGDNKESWDNIDLTGWLNSILAAPSSLTWRFSLILCTPLR